MRVILAAALTAALSSTAMAQAPAAGAAAAAEPAQKAQPSMAELAKMPSDKPKLSYAMGYQLGSEIAGRKVDVDINTVVKGLQDAFAKRQPVHKPEDLAQQLAILSARIQDQAMTEFKKVADENKRKADAYLAQAKGKKGMIALPSGILYRVIDEGTGARPTPTSTVTMHYRGQLTDGTEFDSSYVRNEPATIKLDETMDGWKEVLPKMKVGDRWEIVLPPAKAFGERGTRGIGPNEALVFDIKLMSVK
jgi:FKBP-type peptidyl-prolyl cis-trans isomerase FklB